MLCVEHRADILIAGSGLAGSALALALAQAGREVAVIDPLAESQREDPAFDGRAYALAPASVRLLRAIGIWDRVADCAQPILDISVSDGRPGAGPSPFLLEFSHAEIEEGPLGHMIEDRFLRQALGQAMRESAGVERIAASATAQEATGRDIALTLDSGATATGRLLAGCDGRASPTARRAGIARTGWEYGQSALIAAVAHALPHHGVAHQFFMPAGPLAILPLPGNRSSIVWSETAATAARFAALPDAGFVEALRPRFGDFLGEISLCGQRSVHPLALSYANSFVAERVVLVGDAARGVHPLAGQGLNAGLRDAAALAQVVRDAARRGEDFASPHTLARYQRWRGFDSAGLALATDAANRLFSNDNPLLRAARDLGMAALGSVPALRRALIREAAGLTGETPALMKG